LPAKRGWREVAEDDGVGKYLWVEGIDNASSRKAGLNCMANQVEKPREEVCGFPGAQMRGTRGTQILWEGEAQWHRSRPPADDILKLEVMRDAETKYPRLPWSPTWVRTFNDEVPSYRPTGTLEQFLGLSVSIGDHTGAWNHFAPSVVRTIDG
jgi:hypothetical protein